MHRDDVESSNIKAIGYDAGISTLEVEFTNGSIYQYTGVPEDIHKGLMEADSKGKFLHASVRNVFDTVRQEIEDRAVGGRDASPVA
jgi:hypothetical protein